MDDESIVSLYFSRSESAIRETEAKYGPALSDCAYNILLSRRDTEECVNDAYLGAWNSIPPARPASLRAYLLKITRNIAISRLRQNLAKKRSRELEISLSELEDVLPARSFAAGARRAAQRIFDRSRPRRAHRLSAKILVLRFGGGYFRANGVLRGKDKDEPSSHPRAAQRIFKR